MCRACFAHLIIIVNKKNQNPIYQEISHIMQLLTGYFTLQKVLYCIPSDTDISNFFIVVRAGTD